MGVSDLRPLSGLTQLQVLDCRYTNVSNLKPLSGLTQLQVLNCSLTDVRDLSPLRALTQLQVLGCIETSVSDLSPLIGLTQLQYLDFNVTEVSDLSALAGLTQLQHLGCSHTKVSDLSALAELTQLQYLDCSSTDVSDLRILVQLPALKELYAEGVTIPGIPASGVLSAKYDDNCLPRLRAHYADLAAGAVQDSRVKLLILGNGGAGKTQIAGSLCRADFILNPAWDSTHGIQVEMADLPDGLKLSVWDFGGQDIYHGAHALFLNSPSLMLLVWAADTEARSGVREGAEWFRDYPLPYWVALARQQGHAASAITLVQNKCDQPAAEVRPFPVPATALEDLAFPAASLHISVKNRRGLAGLRERLGEAAQWLRDPARMGVPLIGAGRDRLRQRLEGMQAENKQVPAEQRRRLLSRTEFHALCAEAGGITEPEHVLTWLDAEGVVLYRPGLFDDQVVLDQGWALEAIYAIFDRKSQALTAIRRQDGRFDRDLLGRLVWQGFDGDEQKLFLSMMQSCGICFVHRRWWGAGGWYEEFIAPDLLPDRQAMAARLEARWDGEAAAAEWRMDYPLLHGGLIRTILCMIGELAGPDAVYWQGGVCGYDTNYQSRFWIEQVIPAGGWAGHIHLRTQRGDAEGLLARLGELVEVAQAKVGLRGDAGPKVPRQREGTRMGEVALQPGPEPATGETWYVSYAWADKDTPQREQDVDRLCEAAKAQGRTILRDKNVLRPGDSISDFMRRLGKGDRVFVMLSDKYLKSPNCMFELFMLWQNCQRDGDFKDRVELWVLKGFEIGQVEDWMDRAEYWLERVEKLNARVQNRSATVLGEAGQRQLILMEQFSRHVVDILALFADRVRETTWDEWLKHVLQP
nr:COR domain-containing protein [Niveispirillum sp. SYP-B3756]